MERNSCVDPETLAAWTAGTLPRREADAVETHLADCALCQQMLAVFVRTEPPPVVSSFSWTKWHLRWAVPVAAAATAVAIWVAVPDDERTAQIEDAFATSDPQPSRPAPPAGNQSAAANPPAAPLEKREPPPAAGADSRLEARADAQARSAAATSEREQDAVREAAPAAPAAQPAREQPRPLADTQSDLLRQRQEAFAPVEIASPDPTVRWRILPTGQLERSSDGGATWGSVTLPVKVAVTALRALSAAAAVVTVADGRQFRTEDQGTTWRQVAP